MDLLFSISFNSSEADITHNWVALWKYYYTLFHLTLYEGNCSLGIVSTTTSIEPSLLSIFSNGGRPLNPMYPQWVSPGRRTK